MQLITKAHIKYLFLGVILLFLFHFESLHLGPFKISHLWKGGVLLFFIFVLMQGMVIKPFIYKPLLLIALMQLINIEIFENPLNAVLMFGVALILPLAGMYICRFTSKQLEKSLIFFASFIILCFIPYKLGLLTSLGDYGYDFDSFGGGVEGLVGPFQKVHAASTALAGALLVVVYFWFAKTFNRVSLLLLFILGFYFLVGTYARTGMAMVVIGLVPIVYHFGKKNITSFFRLILMGIITSVLLSTWVLSNETMMNRITGERMNSSELSSFETMGSGRGRIYLVSLEIFVEANLVEKIIGIGQTEEKRRMEEKIGRALIPHTGFLLLLLNNGIIGLFLFIFFLRNIYTLQKRVKPPNRVLIQALFLAYLTMSFFQNYDILYVVLLLMLSAAYASVTASSYRYLPKARYA